MLQRRVQDNENYTKAADLIEPDLKRWREDLLQNIFSPSEVAQIKSIPISLVSRDDQMVWSYTNNGVFLVKNAYHLHKQLEDNQVGEYSRSGTQIECWK